MSGGLKQQLLACGRTAVTLIMIVILISSTVVYMRKCHSAGIMLRFTRVWMHVADGVCVWICEGG